jgi:glutaconate CoA-transferase subunit B
MVTGLGLFGFDRTRGRFRLESVHPGHTLEEILDNTGFEFDRDPQVPFTSAPEAHTLQLLRSSIRAAIAEAYPRFAAKFPD